MTYPLQENADGVFANRILRPEPEMLTIFTEIGLRTCAKIMAQMSGSFKRYTENGKFTAEVILPILPAGDPDGSS